MGTYTSEAFGTIRFVADGAALRFRWGVLEGPVEVFNAEQNQLRFEVAGNGTVVVFRFEGGEGAAKAIAMAGMEFLRD